MVLLITTSTTTLVAAAALNRFLAAFGCTHEYTRIPRRPLIEYLFLFLTILICTFLFSEYHCSSMTMYVQVNDPAPPLCPHGPTLLFTTEQLQPLSSENGRRNNRKRKNEKPLRSSTYYACSANRDVKYCSFRFDKNKWNSLSDSQRSDLNKRNATQLQIPDEEYVYLFDDDYHDGKKYAFCNDCCRILMSPMNSAGVPNLHRFDYHLTTRCSEVNSNLDREYFTRPCKLLEAATANESQAQYFFDDSIAPFVIEEVIKANGFTKVLCIGCPSIHEQIVANHSNELSSFLLDIDIRFQQFYPPHQFARFNMFNFFFFNDQIAELRLQQFLLLKSDNQEPMSDVLLVIDPPFGGRIEFLAESVRKIQALITGTLDMNGESSFLPLILFYPYFNEHWIRQGFNDTVKHTDFIVNYLNHPKLKKKTNASVEKSNTHNADPIAVLRKFCSSTVRMFTNLNRSKINLSKLNSVYKSQSGDTLYRWCELCARYVFYSNRHCVECGECPARDATKPYGHCGQCGRCVKSTWCHCDKCKRCHLAGPCPENLP